ncbi:hypothetical protein BU24DRAFT_76033 [Aaosphaeria arxii CBS 175.79]|uniref:TORC1 subunit TCO89 domain-containing protein n=1 Tax=Aaosphaeria arxii CBS 175.79 TaxID=1450172 RepID=A0A6A5X952_9PLEO|nr:uncharacterized protein BU24DRAFT_76033 [Aaosphaeria arxii CBS 175.79]KAF2009498.1 hypothetical protein BU24DRAFT_76033 [Aaosphaeria arxii CBS 175.79]
MASSSADAHSQSKRPTAMARQTSTSSHVSQSPTDAGHRHAPHKVQRQHVVGQSRMQRNLSLGKNLNKLNKQLTQAQAGDGGSAAKHHRRTKSGDSNSAPSSPRPTFKRNASHGGVVRANHQTHTHAAIRKNHSSTHLVRQGSSKNVLKSSKSEIAPPRKSLAQTSRSRQQSPDPHPTVHFDVANEGGEEEEEEEEDEDEDGNPDDGWTEESASQSPTTTRSNTRSNSVILDPQHRAMEPTDQTGEASQSNSHNHQVRPPPPPPNPTSTALPDRTHYARQANGGNSHQQHSRPPDADMITSRLLQRSASHNAPPQMSSVAATVVSDSHDARILSQSAGSTLIDTPGRDIVSRFMDGDGSADTPKDSSFLPSRNSPAGSGDFNKVRRNKSMQDVAGVQTPTKEHRRSGTTTPTSNLPPSRTQQKLMLQRASSNIEPQKLIPVILPRAGGPTFLQSGMTYTASGEGRLDPRLQQQFNHVAVEYKVVRRYRNPLADAVSRIQQIPGVAKRTRAKKLSSSTSTTATTNGHSSVHGTSSLSTSFNENGVETDGASGGNSTRRSARTSFEESSRRQSFESDGGGGRSRASEVEEICRRLWESSEIVEGD